MQNPNVKYLKTEDGSFHIFYAESGRIFCRSCSRQGWAAPFLIAETDSSIFSLCRHNHRVYLLYSHGGGQLSMASSQNLTHWEYRSMTKGRANLQKTKFFLVPQEKTFHLLYNLPTEMPEVFTLFYTAFQAGQWAKPVPVARFLPLGETPFLAHRLTKEEVVLYYRTEKNMLCAKEIHLSPFRQEAARPLLRMSLPCLDLSLLNENGKLHMLYLLQTPFGVQTLYQCKSAAGFSSPRLLWQGKQCDSCLIYMEKETLIALWTPSGQPLCRISRNGGRAFEAVTPFSHPLPESHHKGEFFGTEDTLFRGEEAYGDPLWGCLPMRLFENALFAASKMETCTPPPLKEASASEQQACSELAALLAQRTEEIAVSNAYWSRKVTQLEAELKALRQEKEGELSPPMPPKATAALPEEEPTEEITAAEKTEAGIESEPKALPKAQVEKEPLS